jgi:hypothetical protein
MAGQKNLTRPNQDDRRLADKRPRKTGSSRRRVEATSKAQIPGPLPSPLLPATFTSTNGLPSLCPPTSLRRLLSPRCNVLNAKPCLWQNSLGRSPLDSNSTTSRLISRRLRRFPMLTTSLSVIPRVHQKSARSTRCVRQTIPLRAFAIKAWTSSPEWYFVEGRGSNLTPAKGDSTGNEKWRVCLALNKVRA